MALLSYIIVLARLLMSHDCVVTHGIFDLFLLEVNAIGGLSTIKFRGCSGPNHDTRCVLVIEIIITFIWMSR